MQRTIAALPLSLLATLAFTCGPVDPVVKEFPPLPSVEISIDADAFEHLLQYRMMNHWAVGRLEHLFSQQPLRMRIHGNVSRRDPKLSFQYEAFSAQRPHRIVKGAILSAQYSDPSFCRYRLASYFFRKAGFLTPLVSAVQLVINKTYRGLYLEIERVDRAFFHRRRIDAASLYKVRTMGRLTYRHGMLIHNSFQKELPEDDRTYTDLDRLARIVDGGIHGSEVEELEKVLDIDNALRYYAVCQLIGHLDGVRNNFYLYRDRHGGRFRFVPWDMDHTFEQPPIDGFPAFVNDFFEHLMEIPDYRQRVRKLRTTLFDIEEALAVLEVVSAEVASPCTYDPRLVEEQRDCEAAVERIREYLQAVAKLTAR
jgi:spore coat protein H